MTNGGGPPDWKAEVDAAAGVLNAAGVPTTPVGCGEEERLLSLAERVQLLVNSRDNHESTARYNASQASKLELVLRAKSPLTTITIHAETLDEAAAIVSVMRKHRGG